MFTKLLIANRGEIACRIMQTAKRLGISTVAIYSRADKHSKHVKLADEAFCVGDAAATQSYLNIDAIINAARASGASAIHPGYGFLSENAEFVDACERAGLIFVGPSATAMRLMGSKLNAKTWLESAAIPLVPGYHGSNQSQATLRQEAHRIGFPLYIKAALGGGGKAMLMVLQAEDFDQALARVKREAMSYFANDSVLLEKVIESPRHIEVQIMADHHGHVVHLFERDCSIQRRHQKMIEEAPAVLLSNTLLNHLRETAVTIAQMIDYRGVGTVEFLVEKNQHVYFLEMNTRLQVEHPTTEMITGLDIVEWQLRIAANEVMPFTQDAITMRGHAIECRVCADDPDNQFLPSIGTVHVAKYRMPHHVRVDSGIDDGDSIHPYYDSLLSKIIAWGETRDQANARMQQALACYPVTGIKTNIAYLQAILHHEQFQQNNITTAFLTATQLSVDKPDPLNGVILATSVDYLHDITHQDPVLNALFSWQGPFKRQWIKKYLINQQSYHVTIQPISRQQFICQIDQHAWTLHIENNPLNWIRVHDETHYRQAQFSVHTQHITIFTAQGAIDVMRDDTFMTCHTTPTPIHGNDLKAPISATVIDVLKQPGESFRCGENLMILEAMKMEHTLTAAFDGQLNALFVNVGAQVHEGAVLATLTPSLEAPTR